MKEIVLNIDELTDSKELYGERPNPFISYFLYSVASLLIVVIIYANVGTIEIVARTTGMIRSNDNVGTIASLISGKVVEVDYVDGQIAQEGDLLFEIDTSEIELTHDTYLELKNEYQFKLDMLDKFLLSIEEETNLFENDIKSDEYSYYIQYYNYELALKNTSLSGDYDENTVNANIQIYTEQKNSTR